MIIYIYIYYVCDLILDAKDNKDFSHANPGICPMLTSYLIKFLNGKWCLKMVVFKIESFGIEYRNFAYVVNLYFEMYMYMLNFFSCTVWMQVL